MIDDPVQIAWAAGLFEGEGTILTHRGRRNMGLAVQMTDEDVLRRFHSVVELGYISDAREDTRSPTYKPTWRWVTSRYRDVLVILDAFEPWFGERRSARVQQAREDIAWITTHCKRGHERPAGFKVGDKCAACRHYRTKAGRQGLPPLPGLDS